MHFMLSETSKKTHIFLSFFLLIAQTHGQLHQVQFILQVILIYTHSLITVITIMGLLIWVPDHDLQAQANTTIELKVFSINRQQIEKKNKR